MAGQQIIEAQVAQLEFDPENPRLPGNIDTSDQDAVLNWMLRDGSIIELMSSIGENGYFSGEPMMVVPSESGEGAYTVIEGNRRLCAVKLLNDPDIAPRRQNAVKRVYESSQEKPESVFVIVFDGRDELLTFLGYRHVTGIKAWNPLAKAKYLKQLADAFADEENIRYDDSLFRDLASTIGSRMDYVARLLTGLAVYHRISEEDFFGIDGLGESEFSFSLLTTALSYPNISRFIGVEERDPTLPGVKGDELKELTQWVFERAPDGKTILRESRNLQKLSRVVEKDDALQSLRGGATLDQADRLTEEPDEVFRAAIHDSLNQMETARDYSHLVKKPSETDESTLGNIAAIATDVRRNVKARLEEGEET